MVARVVESGMATLRELSEYYSTEELYQMDEILHVKAINDYLVAQKRADAQKKTRRR